MVMVNSTISRHEAMPTLSSAILCDADFDGLQPRLVRGGAAGWAATAEWSPAGLGRLCAGLLVDVILSRDGSFEKKPDGSPKDTNSQSLLKDLPMEEAVRRIEESEGQKHKVYISQFNIPRRLPNLMQDIVLYRPSEPNLWFGSGGIETPLHFDLGVNVFAQIYGHKSVTIFPPTETERLYPYPASSPLAHFSNVKVSNPDLEKYPEFAHAYREQFTLHPGDLLLLPPFWWHHIRSTTISVSVSQWSAPGLKQCIGSGALNWLSKQFRSDQWQLFRAWTGLSDRSALSDAYDLAADLPGVAVLVLATVFEALKSSGVLPGGVQEQIEPQISLLLGPLMAEANAGKVPYSCDAVVIRSLCDILGQCVAPGARSSS